MKRRELTATSLRLTLSMSIILIALLASAGFYIANDHLRNLAIEANHASADAKASNTSVASLQKLQEDLDNNREIIERASSIVAESKSYQYQDEIIRDLNNYAIAAGVTITNFNFAAGESQQTQTNNQAATVTPTPAPASSLNGINSTLVSISLQNPVNYDNLLRFFHSIEQNLTKMQIANISLARDEGINVNSEDLTIEVYIR